MESNFSFIFLGLTHGFLDDFRKEEEVIKKTNPSVILSEEMEDKILASEGDYKNFLDKKEHSLMTNFKRMKPLVSLCQKKKIYLIGIDFKNFGFKKELITKMSHNKNLTKKEEKEIERMVQKRESYHIKKILESSKIYKKPILVFLGAWHLRKEGLIVSQIKNSRIIFPADKKGELVVKPTREKIVYMEKNI